MKLCDDVNVLLIEDNLVAVGKLLGVEFKTSGEIPNNVWNTADIETKGRELMQSNQIFKAFSDKIAYLICPEHPTLVNSMMHK